MNKEEIINNIRDCGKYLSENAENLVPNVETDITIWCNVSKKDEVRSIQVTYDIVPPFYIG